MRKGQAAMEFLMTYGWAILVVLIALGALVYFGVISPERFVQDNCTLTPPLSCSELGDYAAYNLAASNVVFRVNNGAGNTITVVDADVEETDGDACTRTDAVATIGDGSEEEFTFTCNDLSAATEEGTRFKGDITVIYTISGGAYDQTSTGQIVARVQ